MSPLADEPRLALGSREALPFLVEHWYLGSRTRRAMMVRRFREVLEHADLAPGQRVLDLGCGWAFGTLWAERSGAQAVGIDLGLDQLRWARHALDPSCRFGLAQANAAALPFRDATFDRAVSVEMMEHVFRPDRARVLGEIARVMKRGGRLALSTPNPDSPIEATKRLAVRWPWLRRSLPSSCFPEAADDRGAYHPYRYHHPLGARELTAGLETAGFRVEGMKSFLWLMKTMPDALLGAGRAAEGVAESTPGLRRFGATTLIWARRS
ncbi:MAG TPA: class I SAM-dependent methyltransferase [Candidatus Udaeobacter sp.]|nr:class I SAM-dependent methyltransferase [Candidatus Udaeobacter sp.]